MVNLLQGCHKRYVITIIETDKRMFEWNININGYTYYIIQSHTTSVASPGSLMNIYNSVVGFFFR